MDVEIIKQLAILIIGFALLVKGADLFVDGASGIAKKFGISELIIGLTIVAMGTSAPEAAVSIAAAAKGSAGISIGNVIGSNIMNIFIILGVVAAIVPLKIERSTVRYEMPFTILVTAVFVLMGRDGLITRLDGFTSPTCCARQNKNRRRLLRRLKQAPRLPQPQNSLRRFPQKPPPSGSLSPLPSQVLP